jgi:hypothetical protein
LLRGATISRFARTKDFPQIAAAVLVASPGGSYSRIIRAQQGTWRMQIAASGSWAFFMRRWQRQVPLGLLFWRDMIVVGSAINLAAAFASLVALGFKADLAIAMLIYLAPMPYNFFLAGAVWRTAERVDAAKASSARLGAILWLAAATVL